LLYEKRNGNIFIPCYDANGNITAYIDTNGVVRAYRHYDAFGNTIAKGGDMVDVLHFWYSTKYLDHDTGLYYYGYRYYAPLLQRWINRDPFGEEGGMNMYGFVGNAPFLFIDKLGMFRLIPVSGSPRTAGTSSGFSKLWASVFIVFTDKEKAQLAITGGGTIIHGKHTEMHIKDCNGKVIVDKTETLQKRISIDANGSSKSDWTTTDRNFALYSNIAKIQINRRCIQGSILVKAVYYLIIGQASGSYGRDINDSLSGSQDGEGWPHPSLGATSGWPKVRPNSYSSFGSFSVEVRMWCPNKWEDKASGRNLDQWTSLGRLGREKDQEGSFSYVW
jgi:RHS repeat-associated protein